MDSFTLKYLIKILSNDEIIGSGVIVKLKEFPNNFFVFTSKHTFEDYDKKLHIGKNNFSIYYGKKELFFKSYIVLSEDIIVFIFDNSVETIKALDNTTISNKIGKFGDCYFRGYARSETEGGSLCEPCEYLQDLDEVESEFLFRIRPIRDTNSFDTDGLSNAKGLSGSGLFITDDRSLVGIIKEHEANMSAYNYIALNPLKEELMDKINNELYEKITIPQHLIDEIKEGNVVLFVGNEFSSEFGLPSKTDFIKELLDRVDEKFAFMKMGFQSGAMTNEMALTLLKNETEIIKNTIIDLYTPLPNNIHFIKTLWKFVTDIVTVNYDKLFENNFTDIKVISTFNNYRIPVNKNDKKLFKLHGTIDDIDNILIFEEDYKELYSKKEIKSLAKLFKDKTCLFIGFSTDEVYFDLMYQAISCKNKNYIISMSNNDFSKYDFEPIFIKNYIQLNQAFSEALAKELEVVKKEIIVENNKNKIIDKEEKTTVCIYTASPLNSEMNYQEKRGVISKVFSKYSVELSHKVLNEDELIESFDFDYNFIFTNTNRDKIIIEDEFFLQKSMSLDELEEITNLDNTTLFLDNKIENSQYNIQEIKDSNNSNKIKRALTAYLHKQKLFDKGKSSNIPIGTEIPIDRKNLNNFVGRATDLEIVIRKILTVKEENKILTIKGSGGIGKTTLISKVIIEMADRGKFKDGIKFVQCEFITDYSDFENKITYTFDMSNALNFEQQLKEQNLDEDRLIVLDNIETLLHIDDTQNIKDLIRTISDYATIVITSREILNERDYEDVYELHKLTTDEAEELFVKLTDIKRYNKKYLRVEILENLLDNNPLAIKLITKNLVKGKPLESLKEELEKSFFDITSDDIEEIFDKESDVNIERTKSLFQSINYSYQKLNKKEKLALEILSLFPDGLHIENLKNFYNQEIPNDKKKQKTMAHKATNFGDREIKSLEDKSLVIINRGFVMLQSIIGRFADYKFSQRNKKEKEEYYSKAYEYNYFLIAVVHDIIETKLKHYSRIAIFDENKNNFIKSFDYIGSLENNVRKLIYIDRVVTIFSMKSSPNKQLIIKLQKQKRNFSGELEKKLIESIEIELKYYYGAFNKMYDKLNDKFPIQSIKYIKGKLAERFYENILNIYSMEGYVFEYIQFYLKNNLFINVSDLFLIGDFKIAKKVLKTVDEKGFFEFELLLAIEELNIDELKRHIKSLFKTEHINKMQLTYTLVKADKDEVKIKDIKKLIVINPFTDGLKSLMLAIKSQDEKSKVLYEDAIEKLYHIRYYHVEAILIYAKYLKDNKDSDYDEWFIKGKKLAKKHHYRYLLHQFICLDSGIETEYDEDNYHLPEQLDYSEMLKRLKLD